MFRYTFLMKGSSYTITASNWRAACNAVKKEHPDCGYLKLVSYQNLDTRVDSSDIPKNKRGTNYSPDNTIKYCDVEPGDMGQSKLTGQYHYTRLSSRRNRTRGF